MNLSSFIAGRYLFAKKSHNVINIISLISAIGIAIGSCALILILSVYNGFGDIVRGMYDKTTPDIVITQDTAKYFNKDIDAIKTIMNHPQVEYCAESIEENVFIRYDSEEAVALLKGVDSLYGKEPEIAENIVDGNFSLYLGEIPHAVCGNVLCHKLKIRTSRLEPIQVYFPDGKRDVNPANPSASLNKATFFPSGIYSSGNEKFNEIIFVDIDQARKLINLDENEVSRLEIKLRPGADVLKIQRTFRSALGDSYKVLNTYQQNEIVYKMLRIEKVVIFLILLFVTIIISCNVFGSLTMLIIEKKNDIKTLQDMGARNSFIQKIFFKEGLLIIVLGAITGIILGIILALIQQYVGIIKMPGNFVVEYYPIILKFGDIILTFAGITIIGLIITLIPTKKTLSKILQ